MKGWINVMSMLKLIRHTAKTSANWKKHKMWIRPCQEDLLRVMKVGFVWPLPSPSPDLLPTDPAIDVRPTWASPQTAHSIDFNGQWYYFMHVVDSLSLPIIIPVTALPCRCRMVIHASTLPSLIQNRRAADLSRLLMRRVNLLMPWGA